MQGAPTCWREDGYGRLWPIQFWPILFLANPFWANPFLCCWLCCCVLLLCWCLLVCVLVCVGVVGPPKIWRFFSLSRHNILSFFPLLGVLVVEFWRLRGRQGFTQQPENSKRAHLRVPALQTPPKFHEKTHRETKRTKWGRERERKEQNVGRSGGGGSGEGNEKIRGLTLRAPLFLVLGPTLRPPSLPLRGSTLWGLPYGGPTMTHTRSKNGLAKNGLAKINMAKNGLAKIGLAQIGQIRMAKTGLEQVFEGLVSWSWKLGHTWYFPALLLSSICNRSHHAHVGRPVSLWWQVTLVEIAKGNLVSLSTQLSTLQRFAIDWSPHHRSLLACQSHTIRFHSSSGRLFLSSLLRDASTQTSLCLIASCVQGRWRAPRMEAHIAM